MYDDIQKADIEMYALGLSSAREAARIERAMEERPELRRLVENIQQDLHEYAEQIQVPPLRPDREPNPSRFSELDEEMLDIMSQQNERLRRWVAVVGMVCLFIAGICVYLYFQNGQLTSQLREERATLRQELNYAHSHLDQAEQRIDAWKADAKFTANLPVENIPGATVALYTFEAGEKVLLNVAKIPTRVTKLAVWDERDPRGTLRHLTCSHQDDLHYLDLDSREQIKWLRIKAVSEADIALSEKAGN